MCLFCLLTINIAHAFDDAASIVTHISGPITGNHYFLCVSGSGCVSIQKANQGKPLILNAHSVDRVAVANITNLKMHHQAVPETCKQPVNDGQTLVVSGHLVIQQGTAEIENLKCSVKET